MAGNMKIGKNAKYEIPSKVTNNNNYNNNNNMEWERNRKGL